MKGHPYAANNVFQFKGLAPNSGKSGSATARRPVIDQMGASGTSSDCDCRKSTDTTQTALGAPIIAACKRGQIHQNTHDNQRHRQRTTPTTALASATVGQSDHDRWKGIGTAAGTGI